MNVFESKQFNCRLYCDDKSIPVVLPCLFSLHCFKNNKGYVFEWKTSRARNNISEGEIRPVNLSHSRLVTISSKLKNFFIWLEKEAEGMETISLENHHNLPEEILNYYINQVLVHEQDKSIHSIEDSVNALNHYYNFLAYHGFTEQKSVMLNPENKEQSTQNTQERNAIKYISAELRGVIVSCCTSIRDECIIKNSAECGLRTKENKGLLLNDFKIGHTVYKGLKSFFKQIDQEHKNKIPEEECQQEYKYWLQGLFTKGKPNGGGGKGRWIYISRELMLRYKLYFETERTNSDSNTLFVTKTGKPIPSYFGTNLFKKLRGIVIRKQQNNLLPEYLDELDGDHTYHCLRHSFATDKFYDFCEQDNIDYMSVTEYSAPYRRLAELLGHSSSNPKHQNTTSKFYIHLVGYKMRIDSKIHRKNNHMD